ncbi:lytic transglycosylase domain-containing protein [Jannaschia sp. LMIT008]|uniref:lytic transglycosylase domain-containing protein n=1 Tax=Jannaschia maritima TaxID=3032585 RepID=UPI002810A840|nr:lytic transglycosylase domain-containing protein [Jannaschia sp. LMIT008]
MRVPILILTLSAAIPATAAAEVIFKRVRPPAPGSTAPRIDIRIDPAPVAAPAPPPAAAPEGAAPSAPRATGAGHDWFWTAVPPGAGAVPGRFGLAARRVADAPPGSGVTAPSLSTMRRIAQAHGAAILRHSAGSRVSPALVLAVIAVESSGRIDALSSAGASGLMQLIPATADRFGVTDRNDPDQNVRGGVAYLDWLIDHFDGDAVLALAGYNAGEGAVRDHGGVPPYRETRAYVPKVMAAWATARLLCAQPPELPGDACLFDATLVPRNFAAR